jgi:hypothetical protein
MINFDSNEITKVPLISVTNILKDIECPYGYEMINRIYETSRYLPVRIEKNKFKLINIDTGEFTKRYYRGEFNYINLMKFTFNIFLYDDIRQINVNSKFFNDCNKFILTSTEDTEITVYSNGEYEEKPRDVCNCAYKQINVTLDKIIKIYQKSNNEPDLDINAPNLQYATEGLCSGTNCNMRKHNEII